MNNKLFTLLIFLVLLPFLGWMYYDWRQDSESIQKQGGQWAFLVGASGEDTAQVQFIFHFPDPVFSHSLSTAQIETLSQSDAGAENYHVQGLTQAGFSVNSSYEVNWSKKWFKEEYAMWVENLRVEFTYDTLNVYVSSGYPESSCEYQATLDHENQHVTVHREMFQQYQETFKDAVRGSKGIPLASNPIVVGSIPEGKQRISDLISAVTDPPFNEFKDALQAEQSKIDTPAGYAGLRSRCQHW